MRRTRSRAVPVASAIRTRRRCRLTSCWRIKRTVTSTVHRSRLRPTTLLAAATNAPRAPAVVVVFDELPLNSLLDRHGLVDPVRFPHFAALQRASTWFANESIVSEGTLHGVPSLRHGLSV